MAAAASLSFRSDTEQVHTHDWHRYVVKTNVDIDNPLSAKVIILLERHGNEECNKFTQEFIDQCYQEKTDLILGEYDSDISFLTMRSIVVKTYNLQKVFFPTVLGWVPPEIKNKEITLENKSTRKVKEINSDILEEIAKSKGFRLDELMKSYGNFNANITNPESKRKYYQVAIQSFAQCQKSLINSVNIWLEKNKNNSSRLFVLAGRGHGNPDLDDFCRSGVEEFLKSLEKTKFIVFDRLLNN